MGARERGAKCRRACVERASERALKSTLRRFDSQNLHTGILLLSIRVRRAFLIAEKRKCCQEVGRN